MLNEWNVDLSHPPEDPRFQPCYVAEVIWQMKEGGLDYSCYYHIRDWHVAMEPFAKFMSPQGTMFMYRWWNRRPQYDGLFDYQNVIRPAYFTFKLLSRLTGERLRLTSKSDSIHGLASWDEYLQLYNVLVWNYSTSPARVRLTLADAPGNLTARPIVLDAMTANNDENARLKVERPVDLTPDKADLDAPAGAIRRTVLVPRATIGDAHVHAHDCCYRGDLRRGRRGRVGSESGRRGAGQRLDRLLRPVAGGGLGPVPVPARWLGRAQHHADTRVQRGGAAVLPRRPQAALSAAPAEREHRRQSLRHAGTTRPGQQRRDRCAGCSARAGSIPGRVGARTERRSSCLSIKGISVVDLASGQTVAHARTKGLLSATYLVAGRQVAPAAWRTRSAPAGASRGWMRRRARSTRSAGSTAARPTGSRTAGR